MKREGSRNQINAAECRALREIRDGAVLAPGRIFDTFRGLNWIDAEGHITRLGLAFAAMCAA